MKVRKYWNVVAFDIAAHVDGDAAVVVGVDIAVDIAAAVAVIPVVAFDIAAFAAGVATVAIVPCCCCVWTVSIT